MDLGEILRVMRARWYIVVPMLLLAVGLGIGAYALVPTSYSTYTMVSLLSAPQATKTATQGQDNPFLNFNGSLVATADFLGRRLQSTDVQLELKNQGVTEKYEVALAENAQGPFLTLTLTGTDKVHLLESAAVLAKYADAKLLEIQVQNNVASRDQIKLTQVIPPQKPVAELKKKLEVVIAAAGGTVALTFVLTFIVESMSRARRRKAQAAANEGIDSATPAPRPIRAVKNKPEVGEETRVITTSATPPKPKPVSKPDPAPAPATNGPAPDSTAIITLPSSLPQRGTPARPQTLQPPQSPPDNNPAPQPRQPAAAAGENNPSRGKAGVPSIPVVPPASGTSRVGSSTTYQSQSADRRGQDANRVNGS